MSQRDSGYERKERDLYETPEWVTEALLPHLPDRCHRVWEPAAGSGKMAAVLRLRFDVVASDISDGDDFLEIPLPVSPNYDAIITNPPYALADNFIWRSMFHVASTGMVAMLLRTDFDHAQGRQKLFGLCPQFAKKLVLTKRIKWFEESKGSPSFNHAWFIWDWKHEGPPTLAYGP